MRLANRNDCTGCLACVDSCPHNVLYSSIDKDGYVSIQVTRDANCVECGICTKNCPVINFRKDHANRTDKNDIHSFAAWNTDSEQRQKSASGGAFSAIATVFLDNNGIVYGASIEGFNVRHIRIERKEDLKFIQGTKYQYSDMTNIYKSINNDLKAGKYVLFSGMSCQVAGVLSFIREDLKKKLYTIDTICSGISTLLPMIQFQETGEYSRIVSFRDKENGWRSHGYHYSLKMQRKDGTIENLGLQNLVLNCFSTRLLKRSSCLNCRFNGIFRQGDCTIGDFWGDNRFSNEHHKGLSALIIHYDRILEFIKKSSLHIEHVDVNDIIKGNPYIHWSHQSLIRKFHSRKLALNALRNKDGERAQRQFAPWSFNGIILRIYLKLNSQIRTIIEKSKFYDC